jgi:hypothetical protein
LHGYNPLIPPHQLEGLATLKKFTGTAAMRSSNSGNFHHEEKDDLAASAPLKLSSISSQALQKIKAIDDIQIGQSTKNSKPLNGEAAELRKIWQGVLRECHRADPERTGQINRNVFIAALERANLPNVIYPTL